MFENSEQSPIGIFRNFLGISDLENYFLILIRAVLKSFENSSKLMNILEKNRNLG